MDREQARKECIRILSKDGSVPFDYLPPIGQATWLAFEKGFMECFDFINNKRPSPKNGKLSQDTLDALEFFEAKLRMEIKK